MGKRDEGSWFMEGIHRRNFRQDHGGGPEEMPYKKGSQRKRKPRKGCPENNNKQHVYVSYTTLVKSVWDWYDNKYRVVVYNVRVTKCCGCGYRKSRKHDYSERKTMIVDAIPKALRDIPSFWSI